MKKIFKIFLVFGAVIFLSLSAFPVNAIGYSVEFTDAQGDVRDDNGDLTNEPNVDIINVKSYKEGQTVNFELKVTGSIITNSEDYVYIIEAGGIEAEIIQIAYSVDNAFYLDQLNPQNMGEAEYIVEGNKLTLGVPVEVFSENIVLRANAAYSNLSTEEIAIDMAPDDGGFSGESGEGDEPNGDDSEETNGDDSKDTDGGSPGFEIIVVLIAIVIALILLRRKK